MATTPPLAEGESINGSSPPGRIVHLRPGNDPRFVMGMFFASFYALGMVITVGVMAGRLAMGGLLLAVVLAFIGWRRLRAQPAYFLTTHRLYERSLFGGPRVIPLDQITRCHRYLNRVRTRYGGIEELPTDAVVLTFGSGGELRFGPVKDYDGLWDLVQNGVLAKSVDLHALPSLDGTPAPAEGREDLFLALHTRKGAETYGPLFIGPTKLIHFTEPLPRLLEGIFLTVLASPASPEQIEPQLAGLVRHPQAGHSLRARARGLGDHRGGCRPPGRARRSPGARHPPPRRRRARGEVPEGVSARSVYPERAGAWHPVAMTVEQIVSAIRALPVPERLRVIELVAHDAVSDVPSGAGGAAVGSATLMEWKGLLVVDAESTSCRWEAFDHRADRETRADRSWSGS